MNQAMIRRAILTSLKQSDPYAMPEPTLIQEVQISVAPPPSRKEVDDEIKNLEAKRLIIGRRDDVDEVFRWRITLEGKLEI